MLRTMRLLLLLLLPPPLASLASDGAPARSRPRAFASPAGLSEPLRLRAAAAEYRRPCVEGKRHARQGVAATRVAAGAARRGSLHEIHAHGAPELQWIGRRSNSTRSSASSLYEIYAHGGTDEEVFGQSVGASYGNYFGPSPGQTWAAEAVILASIRQVSRRQQGDTVPHAACLPPHTCTPVRSHPLTTVSRLPISRLHRTALHRSIAPCDRRLATTGCRRSAEMRQLPRSAKSTRTVCTQPSCS